MGVSVPLLRCVAALKKWVRVGWVVVRVWWCVAVAVGAFLVVMWCQVMCTGPESRRDSNRFRKVVRSSWVYSPVCGLIVMRLSPWGSFVVVYYILNFLGF
jgi:hypothetical protein